MKDIEATGINHISVVTADLERAMRTWHDDFGVGPWIYWRFDDSNMAATRGGEPVDFAMLAAVAPLGSESQMELIQPLNGKSPYAESLEESGGKDHLHHVRLGVRSLATASAVVTAAGAPPFLEAHFDGATTEDRGFDCAYFETGATLGFLLELGEIPPDFTMPEPDGRYPA